MLCDLCGTMDGHESWCERNPRTLFPDTWTQLSLGDELSMPEDDSPVEWTLGADGGFGVDLPAVDPELDMSTVAGDCFTDEFMAILDDLHKNPPGGPEGVVPVVSRTSRRRSVRKSAKSGTVERALVTSAAGDSWEVNLYASDTSLGNSPEPPRLIPIAIPGWNVSEDNETVDAPMPSAWPGATEIADELIRAGTMEGGDDVVIPEPCDSVSEVVGPHTPNYVCVSESPASPDTEVEVEARSDTSDNPDYYAAYRPVTSPVTDVSPAQAPLAPPRELGPSVTQQYWSKLQRRRGQPAGTPYNRIAVVRPQPRRRRRSTYARNAYPRVFRMVTQAPVVRAVSILSHVRSPGGHVAIESLADQVTFARHAATQTVTSSRPSLSRSTATQTFTPLFVDVQTGTPSPEGPSSVVVIRIGGVYGESGEHAAETSSAEASSSCEGTDGTPLMDE
jgi:hypothetical protein